MQEPRPLPAYLVADDSPVVAEAVVELLQELGVAVVGPATDGQEALDLYRRWRPAAAVLDFDMPRLNGLEVLRAIRAEPGDAPCRLIILTASTEASLREACLAAGADHFLDKVTGFMELQAIVAAHLATWAADGAPRQQSADSGSEN